MESTLSLLPHRRRPDKEPHPPSWQTCNPQHQSLRSQHEKHPRFIRHSRAVRHRHRPSHRGRGAASLPQTAEKPDLPSRGRARSDHLPRENALGVQETPTSAGSDCNQKRFLKYPGGLPGHHKAHQHPASQRYCHFACSGKETSATNLHSSPQREGPQDGPQGELPLQVSAEGGGERVEGYLILKSYELKFVLVQRRLNLLVDVGHRILSNLNALQQLNGLSSKDAQAAYAIGKTVVTIYNNRCYRIEKICHDMHPGSTFQLKDQQGTTTFADYYKKFYSKDKLIKNQPMFETITGYENQMEGNKQVRVTKKGYLVPELCRFSAQLSKIKEGNFHVFNDISKKIKIDPETRRSQEQKMITELNATEGKIEISDKCTEVKASVDEGVVIEANIKYLVSRGEPFRAEGGEGADEARER